MTHPDFRALCAELVTAFKDESTYTQRVEILDRARTALATPQPEPPTDGEGKKTILRQAAESAFQALEGWENYGSWVWPVSALEQARRSTKESLDLLRTALATPQPEPPTIMEIFALIDEIDEARLGQIDLVRAALKRWGQR